MQERHGAITWLRCGLLALASVGVLACGDDTKTTEPDDTTVADDTADSADPDDTDTTETDKALILGVAESERWPLTGLTGDVHVVRTEGNIGHIYAENRIDLARVLGFIQARDRFFLIDAQRRAGLGTLTELFGDLALSNDIQARQTGITHVAHRLADNLSPAMAEYLGAFADGVNQYIDAVREERAAAPTETNFHGLLGFDSPADMMKPLEVLDVVAMAALFMYQLNFENGDVGATVRLANLETLFSGGEADAELRKSGFLGDFWENTTPIFPGSSSTSGFGLTGAGTPKSEGSANAKPARAHKHPTDVSRPMLDRLVDHLDALQARLGKDRAAGFGSNAWAVDGSHSSDGAGILANDGHLSLTIPSLAYGMALDTRVFGGGDMHQMGGWLGMFPVMIGGTNGKTAFGGVNPGALDITDWYREEIQLDADGLPSASYFQDEWKPLVTVTETYEVNDVAFLQSVGRTENLARYATFDGRFLVEIEGTVIASPADAPDGAAVVNMMGTWVIPGDLDDDQVITAISFDHAALDATQWGEALFEMGFADDVDEIREATRGFVGAALFTSAADDQGNILYTSYQAVPCRLYLARDQNGRFVEGADPAYLLDGTTYGGFTLPTGPDGKVDESQGDADPYKCVIGSDVMPHTINPDEGFTFTANNDPGGITDDGDVRNDAHYIGGPWASVRANTIRRELETLAENKTASVDTMAHLQADKTSRTGEEFVPALLDAIASAKGFSASDETLAPHEQRLAALYTDNLARFDAVTTRLEGWRDRGFWAASGVATFYAAPTEDDVDDSIGTMIFNAYLGRFVRGVWSDEPIASWEGGDRRRVAGLVRFLAGQGENNPGDMASWNPATEEAVFFDRLGTDEIERSDEIMLIALADGLDFLSSEPTAKAEGGFGTTDMSQWLWGMRHQVLFESLLSDYVSADSGLSSITDMFAITTKNHPLADDLASDDPRKDLKWFPRGGDQWGIDAANPGLSGTRFTHGSGPAMRMVYALKDGKVEGLIMIPGGQSGVVDSPHFDDLAPLWLGNEALPVRLHPADVAAGATGREVYSPAAN
ncbi:MAG: penicillin amidase [Myxococcota bacterium]|jgi:penicillin amidase